MINLWNEPIGRWRPDADNIGAPKGVLLRADNTVPDKEGARSVRRGSAVLISELDDLRVGTIHTRELDGVIWRMLGADNRVYANDGAVGEPFDGEGDIVFGDDSYQIFAARGKTRMKWDGENFHNWSIAAPIIAPTLAAVDAITATPATFNSDESPAFTINEGTSAWANGHDGTANGALELTQNAGTGRASCSKKFTSDQEYYDIGGTPGGATDLFDIRVFFEDWRKVDKLTIMFGLDSGTDPFKDNYYYFDFNIRDKDTVNIKDPASAGAAAYALAGRKALNVLTPQQVTNIRSPAAAGEVLRRLGRFAGPRSTERRDAAEASPAWGHLSVTRGQFNRVGGTSGRSWSTVRGFKVVYTAIPGSTESVHLDDAIWTGGGARSLTGTFTCGYRFARKFSHSTSGEVYYELSPMSPISSAATLNQQALEVTISAMALAAKDRQVSEVWVYLNGGWLDTYYRFAVLPASAQTGLTIDELAMPVGGNFEQPEERTRLTTWGFTHVEGEGTGSYNVVFTGAVSETEILIDNESYVPGTMPVPENIVAIAGAWQGRMFVLDNQGWLHPSGQSPSNFSAYHAVDLRRYGTPLWLAKTSSGITAGFSLDIIRIAGTGEESEDRITVDLWGEPLNIGNPPVDSTIMVDGDTIIYRAADGLMALTANALSPVPYEGTSLLWRGESRHGVGALNITTGRFRLAVDNHILYMLAPEDSTDPTAIWKYYFDSKEWVRQTYPFTPLSIFREPSGALVVGTADGAVHEIEVGEQDEGVDIPIIIMSPYSDGGDPLRRKDPVDFQIHADTGSDVCTVQIRKDGVEEVVWEIEFSTNAPQVYREDIVDAGVFLRSQLLITGSFNRFVLYALNMTATVRPQQVMALDLGYVIPTNGGDMAWLTEAEVDCVSPVDLDLYVYDGNDLLTTQPVEVTPDIRDNYRVVLPRGTKGRRLRLLMRTTNPAGVDDPGFEPYSVKVRHRPSGNLTQLFPAAGDEAAS